MCMYIYRYGLHQPQLGLTRREKIPMIKKMQIPVVRLHHLHHFIAMVAFHCFIAMVALRGGSILNSSANALASPVDVSRFE